MSANSQAKEVGNGSRTLGAVRDRRGVGIERIGRERQTARRYADAEPTFVQ